MPNALIVFDLDFTLWDAGGTWCDHLRAPFRRRNGDVLDADGACIRLYPEVPEILDSCDALNIPMALASRTGAPTWAQSILGLFGLRDRFVHEQIYPKSKDHHFQCLRRASGLSFERMAFFDDEMRNIQDVGALGVHAVHVPNGLTCQHFRTALTYLTQN